MPETSQAIPSEAVEVGDRVSILALPEGLLDGLPPEEVAFLQGAVGAEGTVDEVSGPDAISVRLADRKDGSLHFVWFAREHLLRSVD